MMNPKRANRRKKFKEWKDKVYLKFMRYLLLRHTLSWVKYEASKGKDYVEIPLKRLKNNLVKKIPFELINKYFENYVKHWLVPKLINRGFKARVWVSLENNRRICLYVSWVADREIQKEIIDNEI